MEKPSWVPVVLSGALPRGATDLLAIFTMAIVSVGFSLDPTQYVLVSGIWLQFVTIALVSVLASHSDTARKLREELALIAYGGSGWQIWLRYFVRGLACALLATSPFLYLEYARRIFVSESIVISTLTASIIGGFSYAAPSLARIRSREFAENYKS